LRTNLQGNPINTFFYIEIVTGGYEMIFEMLGLEYNPIITGIIISIFVVVCTDGPRVLRGIHKVYAGKITLRRAIVDGLKNRGIPVAFIIVGINAIHSFPIIFPYTGIGALTIMIMMLLLVVYVYTIRKTPLKETIIMVLVGGLLGFIWSFILVQIIWWLFK